MSIIRLDEVDSTNLYAKSNFSNFDDRSVIISDRQTKGRGRFDRTWIDLGGDNVFMSFVLKPDNALLSVLPNITQYLSVTVCKIMEQYGVKPQIKWPNDVLINGKKICGILSETVMQSNKLQGIVLGIGINLNSDVRVLRKIEDKEATALNVELNIEYIDKNNFIEKLIEEFFRFYDEFLNFGFPYIKQDYLSRACFINNNVSVRTFNDIKNGIVQGVTDNGELLLKNDDKEFILTMGDIL